MNKTILIIGLVLLLVVSSGCLPTPEPSEEKAPPETAAPETVSPATPESEERQAVSGEVTITGELAAVVVLKRLGLERYYFLAIKEDRGYLSLLYSPDYLTRFYSEKGTIIRANTTIAGYTYTHDGVGGIDPKHKGTVPPFHVRYGIRITITGHVGTFDRTTQEMRYWENLEKAGVRDEDGWTYSWVKRAIHVENIEVLTSWDWDELVRQGEAGVERLIQALNIRDGYIKQKAIESLLKIGEPAVEPLIQALKDERIFVRNRAAYTLGEIGDARAVEPLVQALLKDEDEWVRRDAVEALVKIGDPRAVEPLIQVLKDEDEDRFFREYAAEALGELGDPRAVEPLIQALEDDDVVVRRGAGQALDKLGWQPKDDTEKAHYLIAKSMWDELPGLGEPAVEPLIQALKDENWNVRRGAGQALGEIGDARAVEPLIQALKDENWSVGRAAAVEALGEIGDARAVEPLKEALNDEDRRVRNAARDALEKIKG